TRRRMAVRGTAIGPTTASGAKGSSHSGALWRSLRQRSTNMHTPPVTQPDLDLVDQGKPILHGVMALLRTMSEAQARNVLTGPECKDALQLLGEQLEVFDELFERWASYREL